MRKRNAVVAVDASSVFPPDSDVKCGETCDRRAIVDVNGCTYCSVCLERLVSLGQILVETMEQAEDLIERIEEENR